MERRKCRACFCTFSGRRLFFSGGAFGVVEGEELFLRGLYYNEETGNWFKDSIRGKREDAEVLGIALAKQMKESDRTKTDKGEAE